MRVLILGADGMLGHRLLRTLAERHQVVGTVRGLPRGGGWTGAMPAAEVAFGVDVCQPGALERALRRFRPEAVVNAIGLVKQRPEAADALLSIEVNALLPQRLARLCRAAGARLVHFGTDCVFSGRGGGYREEDLPDPPDLYGRSKLLGDVAEPPCLTIRSSLIGLELKGRRGLVEWFLASRGTVKGYRRAVFSGLTTAEMARVVDRLLTEHPGLHGLWHVAAEPITKHTLLTCLARALGRDDVRVEPDDDFACDRSLCGDAFTEATGYRAPPWDRMVEELAAEARARGG